MKRKPNSPTQENHYPQKHNPTPHIHSNHNIKALSLAALLGLASLGITTSCEQEPEFEIPFFNECPKIETNLQQIPTTKGRLEYVFKSLGIIPSSMSFDDVENFCITDKNNNKQVFVKNPKSSDNQMVYDFKNIENGEVTKECSATFMSYYKTFQLDISGKSTRVFSESSSEKNCFLEQYTYTSAEQTEKYRSKITRGKHNGEIYIKMTIEALYR